MSPNEKLVLVVVGSVAAWILVVLATKRLSRPRPVRPDPPTPDLRDEPPAVVNLLVNRGRVTDDAARATLVDLAARRVLEFYQPGDDPRETLVRVTGTSTGFRPYEQRILDRVTAVTGVASATGEIREGYAPLSALQGRHARDGALWRGEFAREVRAEATSAGLTDSWFSWVTMALLLSGAVVSMMAAVAVAVPLAEPRVPTVDDPATTTIPVWAWLLSGCACLLVYGALTIFLLLQQDADGLRSRGRAVAAHWLGVAAWLRAHGEFDDLPVASVTVWDRYLSYGVALGESPAVAAGIDLRVGRIEEAWSRHGGTWRRMRVIHPRWFSPYGTSAWVRLILAGAMLAAGGFAAVQGIRWYDQRALIAVVLVALGAVLAVWAAYRMVLALIDMILPVRREGTMLSIVPATAAAEAMPVVMPEGGRRPWWRQRWMVAVVDTGAPTTRPWMVAESRTDRCRPGDLVVVRGQRFGRWAYTISRL